MKNSIYIVDDHSMLKNGLKNYLESNTKFTVTGAFAGGAECLEALKNEKSELPEIIIIDIQLAENESGFTLVKELKKFYPSVKIIMYSMY